MLYRFSRKNLYRGNFPKIVDNNALNDCFTLQPLVRVSSVCDTNTL